MTEDSLPLSRRVDPPSNLPVPEHPDVAVWRPVNSTDLDAILDTQRLADLIDHPEWTTAREELADDFDSSHIDLSSDSLVALTAGGTVAAYGYVVLNPGQDTRVQSNLLGTVRPEFRGRGIGRLLLDWQSGRSTQQLASSHKVLPGWSMIGTEQANAPAIALAEQAGFSIVRYFTSMYRTVAEPIPTFPPFEKLRIVNCTPEWFEAARVAKNDAFRDHWGSQPTLEERWAQFTGSAPFRSELSWIAVEEDAGHTRVVGIALTSLNEDDWNLQGFTSGYVDLIGVVRDWRGRQLAPALLARLLTSYRDAGLERAVLDVDTASPTGAHSLYERMGFVATTRRVSLVREH